ncbi:hypothetical protein CR194_08150 [Salipaludibacillus keqinensis]|uniref:Uncharacterized protein n=1 Tax=Salipaludibacillus keqinensis TaxID=2045207 RepID=A0A323TDF3_9BACI|nr:hypothetical protein [Salipaludibacillus keqinensis]PYZ93161.1 hypothetical protein CR194_08150 [Salipaludibacillus keqinensis]
MRKKSPLEVPEVDKYLQQYREEIAHEFGIFQSQQQLAEKSSIHHVTNKIFKKKQEANKKDNDPC